MCDETDLLSELYRKGHGRVMMAGQRRVFVCGAFRHVN
jgi:hypothetical protein